MSNLLQDSFPSRCVHLEKESKWLSCKHKECSYLSLSIFCGQTQIMKSNCALIRCKDMGNIITLSTVNKTQIKTTKCLQRRMHTMVINKHFKLSVFLGHKANQNMNGRHIYFPAYRASTKKKSTDCLRSEYVLCFKIDL